MPTKAKGVAHGRIHGELLRGIEREDVERGQVLAKPKSITPHKKFLAEVYVLKTGHENRYVVGNLIDEIRRALKITKIEVVESKYEECAKEMAELAFQY